MPSGSKTLFFLLHGVDLLWKVDLWAQRELMPSHPTVFEGESPMKVPEGLSGPSGSFTDGETEAQGLAWGLSAEVLPRQPCS